MKRITTVLFDLDGTLIGMDQDAFVEAYFLSVRNELTGLGYGVEAIERAMHKAVRDTLLNDGTMTNEARFRSSFLQVVGEDLGAFDALDGYYNGDFLEVISTTCFEHKRAREVLDRVKNKGLRCVLATNPLFPKIATVARMALGGLSPRDFEYVSAYENSSYCKPNPKYFAELLDKLGISPSECVMIGNDTRDDMCAAELGIPIFFLTDCLINKSGVDISTYPHGDFDSLIEYIDSL